jgi:predicted lipoprotein with Yx(FWY)xxD motif
MQVPLRSFLFLAFGLATAAASASAMPEHVAGKPLSGSQGYTLYTYDPDGSSDTSRCFDSCAAVWPPYVADDGAKAAGDFSLTTRPDGKLQWVYKHRPLYLFAGDAGPGDRDGDGVNGCWHLIP